MKNLLILTALLIVSCAKDDFYEEVDMITPDNLIMDDMVGIKLESNFIQNEGLMNVKLDKVGDYSLFILDINDRVVAKEEVTGSVGDNIFKVYTNTLPKSSYRLELKYEGTTVGYSQVNLIE